MTDGTPWDADDLRRSLVRAALAMGVAAVAWFFASGRTTAGPQVPYLAIALGGLLVGGYEGYRWLASGRRRLVARRDAVLAKVVPRAPDVPVEPAAEDEGDGYVGGRGRIYFHRPSCPMVRGRDWPVRSRKRHERDGRRPCGICLP